MAKSISETSCCTDEKVFATLKILNVDQRKIGKTFTLKRGQTVLGRNHDQCDIHLPFDNLSKQHCLILIDNDEHFIMDLDSRNKTYRRTHRLLPNVYYELTNEIKLTFADVECCYYMGEVKDESTNSISPDLAQSTGDADTDTPIAKGNTMNETRDIIPDDDDGSSTSTRTPSPPLVQSVNGGVHERQKLIQQHELPLVKEDEGDDLDCSPPLLAPTEEDTTTVSPFEADDNLKGNDTKQLNDDNDQTLPYNTEGGGADSTLPFDVNSTTSNTETTHEETTSKHTPIEPTVAYEMETEDESGGTNDAPPMGGVIEPTVAYEMETDDESGGTNDAPPMGGVIEPTVAYEMETDDESGGTARPMGGVVEPTVAYEMEESVGCGEVQKEDEKEKVEHKDFNDSTPPPCETGKDTVTMDTKRDPTDTNGLTIPAVTVEDTSKDEEEKSTTNKTRKGSTKKKATGRLSIRRGRSRRGNVTSTTDDVPEQEEEEESMSITEHEEIKSSSQSSQSSITNKRTTNRGRRNGKRQLLRDSDEEDHHDMISATKDSNKVTRSTRSGQEAKKIKIDENEIVEQVKEVKTRKRVRLLDLSDESPDIPTLNKDTENDKESNKVLVSDIEEKPSTTTGRKGRKRKAPATTTKKKENEETTEPKRGTRTNKKSLKTICEPTDCNDNDTEMNSKENDVEISHSKGIKRVNVTIQKVKGKIGGATKVTEDDSSPRVMFTGVSDTCNEGTDVVQNLGGEMVDSVFKCTHLVTDKVRRTVKFLCCLSRGCTIVNTNWLTKCENEGTFVPCESFVIKDKTNERSYKFSLEESIAKARSSPLLQGWSVFVSPNVKPSPKDMGDIIQCAGGKVLEECPCSVTDNQFIISCEEDLPGIKEAIDEGVTVCSSEVLLTGVLRQQLQTELYKVPSRGSSSKRRR